MGLVISTFAKNQLQAMQMTVFILLPSILLSGFMFPIANMPWPLQAIATVIQGVHFLHRQFRVHHQDHRGVGAHREEQAEVRQDDVEAGSPVRPAPVGGPYTLLSADRAETRSKGDPEGCYPS